MGDYKFYWMGCKEGLAGVGVIVAQRWVDSVMEVTRVSEKIIVIRLSVEKTVVNILSICSSSREGTGGEGGILQLFKQGIVWDK